MTLDHHRLLASIETHEQRQMDAAATEVAKAEMVRRIAEKAAKTAAETAANPGADAREASETLHSLFDDDPTPADDPGDAR